MSTIQEALEKILEYRELGGNTDTQFIATVARLVYPKLEEQELATRYEIPVSDAEMAELFLQHSEDLIEEQQNINKWAAMKKAERQQEEGELETLRTEVDERLQNWFGRDHQPMTRLQAEQLYDAADGDLELVEDALRILMKKKISGKRIYSPIGLMLTLLKQPEESIRREAAEVKKNYPKWWKVNRDPIPVEDD